MTQVIHEEMENVKRFKTTDFKQPTTQFSHVANISMVTTFKHKASSLSFHKYYGVNPKISAIFSRAVA